MATSYGDEKYKSKQRRRHGLQKTKYYCQVCERQCMDSNGFKCHIESGSHIRKLKQKLSNTHNDSSRLVQNYSNEFLKSFLGLLQRSHGEKSVNANRFYQEYIENKNHVHLNSTKWSSLSSLVKYLGDSGKCLVELEEEEEADESVGEQMGRDARCNYRITFIGNGKSTLIAKKERERKLGKQQTRRGLPRDKNLEEQIRRGMKENKKQPLDEEPKEKRNVIGKIKIHMKTSLKIKRQYGKLGKVQKTNAFKLRGVESNEKIKQHKL